MKMSNHLKKLVKNITPPFIINYIKQGLFKSPSFDDYASALVYCQPGAYEADEVVRVVVEKNLIFRKKIDSNYSLEIGALRTIAGVALAAAKESLNVIDFGGGAGYHYTIAKRVLGKDFKIKWHVVETKSMVDAAKKLENEELKFFDNIHDAVDKIDNVDLVFSSGALHCCPNPLKFLSELLLIESKYLFITRTSFSHYDTTLVNIHKSYLSDNGPGPLPDGYNDKIVSYPNVFESIAIVERLIEKYYDIKFKINEESNVYSVGDRTVNLYGYFCERKAK